MLVIIYYTRGGCLKLLSELAWLAAAHVISLMVVFLSSSSFFVVRCASECGKRNIPRQARVLTKEVLRRTQERIFISYNYTKRYSKSNEVVCQPVIIAVCCAADAACVGRMPCYKILYSLACARSFFFLNLLWSTRSLESHQDLVYKPFIEHYNVMQLSVPCAYILFLLLFLLCGTYGAGLFLIHKYMYENVFLLCCGRFLCVCVCVLPASSLNVFSYLFI